MIQRRTRAVLITALLWASVWGVGGLVQGLTSWFGHYREGYMAYGFLMWQVYSVLLNGVLGALTGCGFAILLARAERDRTIEDLSLSRTVLWGGAAGAASLLLYGLIMASVSGQHIYLLSLVVRVSGWGLLGALAAGGSLAAARKGRLSPPSELPQLPAA